MPRSISVSMAGVQMEVDTLDRWFANVGCSCQALNHRHKVGGVSTSYCPNLARTGGERVAVPALAKQLRALRIVEVYHLIRFQAFEDLHGILICHANFDLLFSRFAAVLDVTKMFASFFGDGNDGHLDGVGDTIGMDRDTAVHAGSQLAVDAVVFSFDRKPTHFGEEILARGYMIDLRKFALDPQ
jgi:hypothetical protein